LHKAVFEIGSGFLRHRGSPMLSQVTVGNGSPILLDHLVGAGE
jgi:hypothetical protein